MTATLTTSVGAVVCHYCNRRVNAKPSKDGGVKLPLGWKRERTTNYEVCRDCWRERYLLRALTFAVASPLSGTWKELEADLRIMWQQTTQASNWMMTQCYLRDIHRDGSVNKMPAMPRTYLYPEARILFPGLPPQTIVSLEQSIQRKYRATRYEVGWTCARSLATMRYPQPFPIHNQSWEWQFNEAGQPEVRLRIGSARWALRLKSGSRYHRQIAGLRRMVERGELAVYKTGDGTILVKLVGWLARDKERVKGESTLIVRTGKDHLLSALDIKGERIWKENLDQLPQIVAAHRNRLQRFSEDQKAEQRPVPSFAAKRAAAAEKYRNRMKSSIQEAAAHLASFAARRKYAVVLYDDSERWLEQFPYFQLEDRIKTTLDERGIRFKKAEASGAETQEPLTEDKEE